MGSTDAAYWSAIGVKQDLDSKNTNVTYIGTGRISGRDMDADALNKQAIVVINTEMYHKISDHSQYSYAVSYRRQNHYTEIIPQEYEISEIHQEFRVYARFNYTLRIGTVRWKNTYRQEVRKFYTPGFENVEDGFQLRSRLKTQASVPLGNSGKFRLLGTAEALLSMSKDLINGWGKYSYKESRFCLYFSYTPQSVPVTFDVGYMNNLIGYGHNTEDVNYLAVDVILENIF